MHVAVFRWKAVGPLLAFGALGAAAWLLFAERIARRAIETVGTAVIGAKVEIRALALSLGHGSVALRGLTVASPFRPLENLLQADELVADLDLLPLLEKKVVIDRLAAKGLKFATPRATDGRTRRQAGGLMDQVEHWGAQLRIPALQLAHGTIGVGRLDPAQRHTPPAAPDIGAALFGAAAIERFQRALSWAQLTRRYMPPGLLPRAAPGPKRVRRAGTTVHFPRERAYPAFLLRSGEFSFQLARAGGEP